MQVVHTTVQANGHTKVEIIDVHNLKRAYLLTLVGEEDFALTFYDIMRFASDVQCVILKCPQDKAWTFDVHTFTEIKV